MLTRDKNKLVLVGGAQPQVDRLTNSRAQLLVFTFVTSLKAEKQSRIVGDMKKWRVKPVSHENATLLLLSTWSIHPSIQLSDVAVWQPKTRNDNINKCIATQKLVTVSDEMSNAGDSNPTQTAEAEKMVKKKKKDRAVKQAERLRIKTEPQGDAWQRDRSASCKHRLLFTHKAKHSNVLSSLIKTCLYFPQSGASERRINIVSSAEPAA